MDSNRRIPVTNALGLSAVVRVSSS